MNHTKNWLIFGAMCFSTFVLHLFVHYQTKIWSLEQQLLISQKCSKIDNDQIRDLMFEIQKVNSEKNYQSSSQYVAGILDAINRKDEFNEIWHAGYNRGAEVQAYSDSSKAILTTSDSKKD